MACGERGWELFWGKGDTSKLDDDVQGTLAHLRRMEETGHIVALSPEQAQVALRAVAFYGQWETMLKLLMGIKNVALLVGALLAVYWAMGDWIVNAIREIAGAPK